MPVVSMPRVQRASFPVKSSMPYLVHIGSSVGLFKICRFVSRLVVYSLDKRCPSLFRFVVR